jgi:hypothetical protein
MQVPIERDLRLNPFYTVRALLVARGLIRFTPPPRALLRGKPIWQLLHEASVDTAVVRFRFTYPPEGQASIAVSDWVGHDQWESLGVKREPSADTVTPPALANELLAPFRSDEPSDPTLFTRLLPGPAPAKPADSLLDPIQELRIASDIDNRTWEVSEAILRKKPAQPFLAVYIGGLDSIEHAFWPYRFPEDFPVGRPAQTDVERLGPVLDRYVTYFDQRLNQLLALYSTMPNVVIVSDHGNGPTTLATSWRGWHTKDGIFLAAGPSVPHRSQRIDVSYYDVVPTIAALKGFPGIRSFIDRSPQARTYLRGTVTVTVDAVRLPAASVHSIAIVYTRPDPLCQRSALSFSVRGPVISQSMGPTSPPPRPDVGSLLVTETIRHPTLPPHASVVDTVTTTGTIS